MAGNSIVSLSQLAGKYLTFKLDAETYGIEILKIQEIIGILCITHVPNAPHYIRGVFNLRGKVIPVIDLRLKFNMKPQEDTERTCIVVVQVTSIMAESGNGYVTMGVLVDEVSEVSDIAGGQIEPPPSFGSSVDSSFIMGMGKINDRVVILLDADQVLAISGNNNG